MEVFIYRDRVGAINRVGAYLESFHLALSGIPIGKQYGDCEVRMASTTSLVHTKYYLWLILTPMGCPAQPMITSVPWPLAKRQAVFSGFPPAESGIGFPRYVRPDFLCTCHWQQYFQSQDVAACQGCLSAVGKSHTVECSSAPRPLTERAKNDKVGP
jgi:hypothetical protein